MAHELVPIHVLFEIERGNKFDLNKMEIADSIEEAVAFIGRSGERNGVSEFVKRKDEVEPYESGLITVALGGSILSSFVQSRPFYTAQNIDVLRPRKHMTLDTKLYYCLCIEVNRFRYSTHGREANRTLRNLLVPALKSVPQWVTGVSERVAEEFSSKLRVLSES